MGVLEGLSLGIDIVFSVENFMIIFFGIFIGTLVGALPGLGSDTGVAVLLPTVFAMDREPAILMLIGVYFGATFGGAITAILINTPGTPAASLTAEEGYILTQKGMGGQALGIAAISSFIGVIVSFIGIAFLAPVIVEFALAFGPAEYCTLILLGLSTVVFLGKGSIVKALISAVFGIFLGLIGTDPLGGYTRFSFGETSLLVDGIDFVVVAMGIFAVAEIFINIETGFQSTIVDKNLKIGKVLPNWNQIKTCISVFLRAPIIGFIVGVLPAAGQTVAAFVSYVLCKRTSKYPERYGTGILEGVAASECSNTASCGGALLPTMTLGVPGSGTTALILAAFIMFGLRPGPLMFTTAPDISWAIIVSIVVAGIFLFVLNGPLVPYISIILLIVPYYLLYPIILLFVITGSFALMNHVFNIYLLLAFGYLGYLMQKLDIPKAPLLLGLVLGPIFETSLRQAVQLSGGNLNLFFTRPIPLTLLILNVILLLSPLLVITVKNKLKTVYK